MIWQVLRYDSRRSYVGDPFAIEHFDHPLSDPAESTVGTRKELAGQGLDAGPQTIAWHLEQHHLAKVSPATVTAACPVDNRRGA
jgi:hypothetical protein